MSSQLAGEDGGAGTSTAVWKETSSSSLMESPRTLGGETEIVVRGSSSSMTMVGPTTWLGGSTEMDESLEDPDEVESRIDVS
jgi:hypothetical protein